jgi:hypothetical protein
MKFSIKTILILVIFSFFQTLCFARENEVKLDNNVITSKDIFCLTYCYNVIENPVPKTSLKNLCIDYDVLKPGQKITILGKPLYYVVTGERTRIVNDISEHAGTRLIDVKKSIDIDSHNIGVLNKPIKDFKKLELNKVNNSNKIKEIKNNLSNINAKTHFIQNLQNKIEANCYLYKKGEFPKIFDKDPIVYEFSSISKSTYLIQDATYDQLIMLKNSECTLLTHPGYGSYVEEFLKINNQYFLKIKSCQYETDACSTFFHEIN